MPRADGSLPGQGLFITPELDKSHLNFSGRAGTGTVSVRANRLLMSGGESGRIGNLSASGGTLTIDANELELRDGSTIDADAPAGVDVDGGKISMRAGRLLISGDARISSWTQVGQTGKGGLLEIEADTVELRNGGSISTTTNSNGDAGTVRLNANRLIIAGGKELVFDDISFITPSGIFAGANTEASGNGGRVEIVANQVEILNGGEINTLTEGVGNAGEIDVRAKYVFISGDGAQTSTGIFSSSGPPFSFVLETLPSPTVSPARK